MFKMDLPEIIVSALAIFTLLTVSTVFYTLTLHRALSRCAPESRTMEPGLVWLLFIPFFNLIWNFLVVLRMAESLRNEFQRRGESIPDTGRELGLAMSILACLGVIPIVGLLCALAGAVCWILYWVKISGLSGRLAESAPVPMAPRTS